MPTLIWNKGIAAACHWRIPDEFPSPNTYSPVPELAGGLWSRRLPADLIANPTAFAAVRLHDLIWVRLSWLKAFLQQALPQIRNPFLLLTADSDSSVPHELLPEAQALLGSPLLIHWFTQNHDATLPDARVSPLPIGIDFHTLAQQPAWGEPVTTPEEQEQLLETVRKGLRPAKDRIPGVYLDYGWKRRGPGLFHYRRFHRLAGAACSKPRPQLVWELRHHPHVHIQPGPLPRSEMWRTRGQYAYVLSVPGMGLDTHRTWEALALGHIVLTLPSSLDPLYDGLPVKILQSWQDINPDNLERWRESPTATPEKLTTAYWVNHIRSRIPPGATIGV